MARPTLAQAIGLYNEPEYLLAIIASGKNPDGTDYTLPVTQGGATPLTPSAPASVSVGAASGVAVAANANRKGLVLTNTSPNTISLAYDAPAVLNKGITLASWQVLIDLPASMLGEVRAIASVAGSILAIQEMT